MVKSFVLMIDLKCDDLIRSLFEVLFSSASKDHSIRVEVRACAGVALERWVPGSSQLIRARDPLVVGPSNRHFGLDARGSGHHLSADY